MKSQAIVLTLMGFFVTGLALLVTFVGKVDVAGRDAPMSGEMKPAYFISLESDPVMFLLVVGFLGLVGLFLFWGGWQQWRRARAEQEKHQ